MRTNVEGVSDNQEHKKADNTKQNFINLKDLPPWFALLFGSLGRICNVTRRRFMVQSVQLALTP